MIQEDCMFHWDTGLELPFNVFMREKHTYLGFCDSCIWIKIRYLILLIKKAFTIVFCLGGMFDIIALGLTLRPKYDSSTIYGINICANYLQKN